MAQQHPEWAGAPGELQRYGPRFAARVQLLDQIFRRQRPERALDIGCGRGAVTRVLARQAQTVVATEVSTEAVQAATESLADLDNVEVHLLDLFASPGDEPPLSCRPFNLVLLSEVLEHLDDDLGALRKIRPLLDDAGILVITVPRDPSLWSVDDELSDHKRRYLKDDLIAKLRCAGFRTRSMWTWGHPLTKYLVLLQIWRLERRNPSDQGPSYRPFPLPRPFLHLARAAFALIARLEQVFKGTDRGIGYVVIAEPEREEH